MSYVAMRGTFGRGWPVVTEESVTHPVPADESPLTFSESDQGASGSVGAGCFAEMAVIDGSENDQNETYHGNEPLGERQ